MRTRARAKGNLRLVAERRLPEVRSRARRLRLGGQLAILSLVVLRVASAGAAELPHGHVSAGDIEVGGFSGYGWGFVRAPAYRGGETDQVDAVPLFPQIGYRVTDRLGGDAWYAGSFEVLLEGTLLWQTQPRSGFGGGAGLLFRYDLLSVPYVVPFGELGGGMLDLDFGLNDQADGFNFTLHGGVGVRYFVNPNWSLSLAYRWQHISNAGTTLPNDGIDMHQPLLGVSYVFKSVFGGGSSD